MLVPTSPFSHKSESVIYFFCCVFNRFRIFFEWSVFLIFLVRVTYLLFIKLILFRPLAYFWVFRFHFQILEKSFLNYFFILILDPYKYVQYLLPYLSTPPDQYSLFPRGFFHLLTVVHVIVPDLPLGLFLDPRDWT